jgi:lysozyme family protein
MEEHMDLFDPAFAVLVSPNDEGSSWSGDPNDPGNWTGGRIGAGELKGSKFGISAAAHPNVDIAALTRAAAGELYRPTYWDPHRCGEMPWD